MPKNLLQDMVRVKQVRKTYSREPEPEIEKQPEIRKPEIKRKKSRKTRYALWIVAVISAIFFLFALSYLFLSAEVTVNPKMQELVLNENLSASKNANTDALSFDLVVISGEENKKVSATEEKEISERAKGTAIIYNTFSSSSQLLSIDTRLEGSNGKIYKTEKQIVVPGMKDGAPSSIEVGIYAAEAGEEYNSGPLDFTIFGFKGTPKYSKFYGRSKGDLSGGFKGKSFVLSDAEKEKFAKEMNDNLKVKLLKKATDQIPDGFILFKDAVYLYTDESNIESISSKEDSLSLKFKGTLYGLLFNEQKLSKKIAETKIQKYDGSPVYMTNIKDLNFSLSAQPGLSDGISFGDIKNINFNLSGATKIVWELDADKLKESLAGKPKKDFNKILLQYPNIDSADLVLSPVWRRHIPDKPKDIKITVNYPN